eukprot:m.135777 g.135777  ORF g.135777 m.135777 type:complete len:291 (-) comp16962_c0_seq3:352-1224(-)
MARDELNVARLLRCCERLSSRLTCKDGSEGGVTASSGDNATDTEDLHRRLTEYMRDLEARVVALRAEAPSSLSSSSSSGILLDDVSARIAVLRERLLLATPVTNDVAETTCKLLEHINTKEIRTIPNLPAGGEADPWGFARGSSVGSGQPGVVSTEPAASLVSPSQLRHRTHHAQREQLLRRNEKSLAAGADEEKQRRVQEEMAKEMVDLAKNMKHNAMSLNDLLRHDTELLEATDKQVDANIDNLALAREQLQQQIEANGGCWVWMMLALVVLVFVLMVVFIKITNPWF